MSFSRRYLLFLIGAPALLTAPLATLFLSQVETLSPRDWILLASIAVLAFGVGAIRFIGRLISPLEETEAAIQDDSARIPALISAVLRETVRGSAILWIGAGMAVAVLASIFVASSFLAIGHYLVAAFIGGAPAVGLSYALGKHLLVEATENSSYVRYVGTPTSVGTKTALLFVGLFLISSVALVQLISSRVSITLEQATIDSARRPFENVAQTAGMITDWTPENIAGLEQLLPTGFHPYVIASGKLITNNAQLTADELANVARLKSGDSTSFTSSHVTLFRQLPEGMIFGITVPWEAYSSIPRQIALYAMVIAAVTALIFIAATIFLSRELKRTLHSLSVMVRSMAEGDFSGEVRIFSDDEIGQLASSFSENRDNLRRLIGKVSGSGSTITEGVHVITGGTGALVARSREQSELTADSSSSLERVKEGIGDLVQSGQKISDLVHDTASRSSELLASSEEVARNMDHLFQSVEKTSGSITQISAAAGEMSSRTGILSTIGDEVLSFVTEMEATIEELRQSSRSTAEISRQVQEAAAAGGEAVKKTVEGIELSRKMTEGTSGLMSDLQKSVRQITQIVHVIEDITDQTNLLALNASIIAAQSGEDGRGFTVVAEQIRGLAERTRISTREIAGIIKAIQGATGEVVDSIHEDVNRAEQNVVLAGEASISLLQILESTGQSYEMTRKISSALEDQSRASRHLHEVASRVADHIGEINRGTREQASGTQLLADEAERVREIALQVRNASEQQKEGSRGISLSMEQMAADARAIQELLQQQLQETERIATASRMMLQIAQDNDVVAQQFRNTVGSLLRSGEEFEAEVRRFRLEAGSRAPRQERKASASS